MSDLITLLSIILSVVALGLSIWQTKLAHQQIASAREQAKDQEAEAKRQMEKLITISDALSTKYLGAFPEYCTNIATLISKATQDLKIICSTPTIAVYSNPEGWFAIKQAIQHALRPNSNIKVSCVFANPEIHQDFLKKQFKEAVSNWNGYKSVPENVQKIETFRKRYDKELKSDLTSERFFALFADAITEELRSTYKGAEIAMMPHRPALLVWIVDQCEAVFVISSTFPSYLSEAFWTTDSGLISALVRLHEEYRIALITTAPQDST